MKPPLRSRRLSVDACLTAFALLAPLSLRAASITWDNSGTDFNDGASWVNDVAPDTGDRAIFGPDAPVTNPVLTAAKTVQGLSFTAAGYTLSSQNDVKLTLTSTATTAVDSAISSATAATTTIAADLILGQGAGTATFNGAANSSVLTITGDISESAGPTNISLAANAGLFTFAGNNTYTGNTTINTDVKLNLNSSTAIGSGALNYNASNGTALDNTSGRVVTLDNHNNLNVGTATLTFTGTNSLSFGSNVVTYAGNRTFLISGSMLTLGSLDSDAAARTLAKNGVGVLTVTGAAGSNLTGTVSLNAGTTLIGNKTSLGAGALNLNGGFLGALTDLTLGNAVTNATTIGTNASGAIGASSLELTALTVPSTRTLTSSINGNGKQLILSNPTLTIGGNNATAAVLVISGFGSTLVSGNLTNNVLTPGTSALTLSGAGTTNLTGTNTYTGTTTVGSATNGGTTLVFDYSSGGAPAPTAAATVITMGGGTLTFKGNANNTAFSSTVGNVTLTAATGLSTLSLVGNGSVTLGTATRNTNTALVFDVSGQTGGTGFTTSSTNSNGALSATVPYLYRTSATTVDFAAATSGVVGGATAAGNLTPLPTSPASTTALYLLNSSLQFASNSTPGVGAVRITTDPNTPITLDLNTKSMTVSRSEILVDGTGEATISNGTWANGGVLAQFSSGTVTLSVAMGNSLQKFGPGLLVGNQPTTTGNLTIGGGIYRALTTAALYGTGSTTISGGAVLELGFENYAPATAKVSFVGNGGFSAFGADRTVNINNGATLSWGGTDFIPANNVFVLSSSKSDSTLEFQNPINLTTMDRTVEVANGSAATDARLTGSISGSGAFVKRGAGALEITGASTTFTGLTYVNAGTLRVAASGALGSGSSGTVAVNVASGARLQIANNATTDHVRDSAYVNLAGGTLGVSGSTSEGTAATGTGNSFTGTQAFGLGPLALIAGSTLDFDSGSNGNVLVFSGLSGVGTSGFTLTIAGYTNAGFNLSAGNSGAVSDDRLIFSLAGGLTTDQLAAIDFGGGQTAQQLNLGNGYYEVSAIPEPAVFSLLAVGALAAFRRRRLAGV